MKKSFLALAVAALAATSIASTASAATVYDKDGTSLAVYGRVQSVLYSAKSGSGAEFDDGSEEGDNNATVRTSGRLGVDMRSQIFGDVAAFAKMEWDAADADGHNSFGARYLWVGLDFAQAGQVKFGRFEPALKYAISQTDIFDDWGCTGLAGNDDKRKAVLQYQWSGMGFDFLASYVFPNSGEHIDGAYYTGRPNQDGDIEGEEDGFSLDYTVSFAAGYTSPDVLFGPIAFRVGYEKGEFADDGLANTNREIVNTYKKTDGTTVTETLKGGSLAYDDYSQYAVGLSWGSLDMGPYVAAQYQQRTFDVKVLDKNGFTTTATGATAGELEGFKTKVTGYEIVAGYAFPNGISVRTGYLHQTFKVDGESVKAATVPVYANWQINPQFNVWAEARFDAGTDDQDDGKNFADATGTNYNENVFSTGLRYQF